MSKILDPNDKFINYFSNSVLEKRKKNYSKSKVNGGKWTSDEHNTFISEILKIGINNWKKVKCF